MKIAVGWDHHGRGFRDKIVDMLSAMGHEPMLMGAPNAESSDYPEYAFRVGEAVVGGVANRGILVCGTGIGMAMAANKVRGVRAGVVEDVATARLSREHNNLNVLCVGEKVMRDDSVKDILETWLTTPFAGGRHARRVAKITDYEKAT
jgi:ribose 5-phosphate isomerase B